MLITIRAVCLPGNLIARVAYVLKITQCDFVSHSRLVAIISGLTRAESHSLKLHVKAVYPPILFCDFGKGFCFSSDSAMYFKF